MTPGILRYHNATASIDDQDVWKSDDPELANYLNTYYAPKVDMTAPSWVRAFLKAVERFGATVIQRPRADPLPPGTIR